MPLPSTFPFFFLIFFKSIYLHNKFLIICDTISKFQKNIICDPIDKSKLMHVDTIVQQPVQKLKPKPRYNMLQPIQKKPSLRPGGTNQAGPNRNLISSNASPTSL